MTRVNPASSWTLALMLGLASPSALAQVTPAPPAPAPAEAAEEEAVEEGEEEEGEEEEGEEEEGEGEEEEATEEAEATPSTPVLVLPYEGVYRSVPQEMLDAIGKIKVLSVAMLMGEAIHRIHNDESVSSLFSMDNGR